MKIYFLGTNGWYTTPTGNTPCILIDSKESYIVLDAGNGLYQIDEYIKDDKKPIHMFISHFHIDHISGVHTLAKFKFPQGMNIHIPSIRMDAFNTLVNFPYTVLKDKLPDLKVVVTPIDEGESDFGFKLNCIRMFHAFEDWGYRFELEGKIISYSGDTGICDNSYELAKNADLLIHECSWEPGHKFTKSEKQWGHVEPLGAAKLAKDANVKKLALTHFASNIYTDIKMRNDAEAAAKKIFKSTIAAKDGLVLEV